MAIDTIKSTAVLDGAISTADIADDAVTSAKLDTNIDIAGTLDVTGATTLDSTLTSASDISINASSGNPKVSIKTAGVGNNPFTEYRAGDNTVFDNMGVFSSSDDYWRVGHGGSGSVTTELMAVKADGNVLIHNGNLQVAAGHGIDFSSNTNLSGMTSELLDEYEEGTYTPNLRTTTGGSLSMGMNKFSYTKIGNLVHVGGRINIASQSVSGRSGPILIDWPFAHGAGTDHSLWSSLTITTHGINFDSGAMHLFMETQAGNSYGTLYQMFDNTQWVYLDGGVIKGDANEWLYIQGSYKT
mgnify:CR=1 FL=1